MARGLSETITGALSGLQLFPFFCLDFTDGTNDYKYTTLDVPIKLTGIDFDNDPNIIVDTYELDAKEFSDWTDTNSSITADSTTAPDGTGTGVKLTEDATAGVPHKIDTGTQELSDDTSYTWSIFVKSGTKSNVRLQVVEDNPYADKITMDVDLDAGTIDNTTATLDCTLISSSITSYPNGWYLLVMTGQFGSAASNDHLIVAMMTETNSDWVVTYDGDGASYIYIWGAKMTQSSSYQYSSGDGNYDPRGFEFESINYTLSNVMDDCTLRIDNLDSVLTSIFVDNTIEEQEASVYLGLMDTDDTVLGTVLMFTGEVDSFELDESEVRMVIGSKFTRWGNQAYNKHSASCRWKVFKGDECGYAGGQTWCDRSYTRCVVLGATATFGGFRFLPSIENRKIWWGPNPSQRRAEG